MTEAQRIEAVRKAVNEVLGCRTVGLAWSGQNVVVPRAMVADGTRVRLALHPAGSPHAWQPADAAALRRDAWAWLRARIRTEEVSRYNETTARHERGTTWFLEYDLAELAVASTPRAEAWRGVFLAVLAVCVTAVLFLSLTK
ncbi:MAG TPA: hypothetical protein VKD22_15615 [Ramlibacter sp.]|jgi:hypothetical protein|nr:hypothetical protein [Ramlibacter sp.]